MALLSFPSPWKHLHCRLRGAHCRPSIQIAALDQWFRQVSTRPFSRPKPSTPVRVFHVGEGLPTEHNMADTTPREPRKITSAGKEYLPRCAEMLSKAFVDDPVMLWLMHDTGAPGSPEMDRARFMFLSSLFKAATLNKGLFVEADDFASCALVMPPGHNADNPWTMIQAGIIPALWTVGFAGMKRIIFEYNNTCQHMLPKVFSKEEQQSHWYIIIIGTVLERRRQGLASDVMRYIQDLARKDGRPVWIESTTEISRDLYMKNGFKEIDDVVVCGKGKVGADGLPKKGGEGVTIRCLYWRP